MSHIVKDNQEPESGAVNKGITGVAKSAKNNYGWIVPLIIVAVFVAVVVIFG